VAVLTGFVAADGHSLFRAEHCFLEFEVDIFAQICAALGAAAASASSASK
jgi:hypothetical protein